MTINFNPVTKIIYQTPKEFAEVIKNKRIKEVGKFPHYTFADKVTSPHPKYSQYANTCSILNINDTMVHLAPEQRTSNLLDKIADLVKREKDEKGGATAFLLGGFDRHRDPKSYGMFVEIGNTLEKEGADFSMICGKNKRACKALDSMFHKGDTFVFTQEYNPELTKMVTENKNVTSDGLQKIFELFYDIVDISPNHKLMK